MTFIMIYLCSKYLISYHTEAFVKTEVGCTIPKVLVKIPKKSAFIK